MATGFDLIGLLLIVIMAVSGLKKGLIDGVLKIVGIYAAVYTSMNYNQYGTVFLEPLISIPEAYKTPAGFIIVFLVTMYSITFVSFLLKKLVRSMNLGVVDRIGGITFGALKAGMMLSAVVWAFAMVPQSMRGNWQEESKLYPFVEIFAGQMVQVFSLEDELAMLQTMMDPDADKSKLLEMALGSGDNMLMNGMQGDSSGGLNLDLMNLLSGQGGDGSLSPDILKQLGGSEGGDQEEILKKALESMGGSQKGLMQQMLKSAGVEGLGGEDGSDLDIMGQVNKAKTAGMDRQAEMERMLDQIEAEAQGRNKAEADSQAIEELEAEAQGTEE